MGSNMLNGLALQKNKRSQRGATFLGMLVIVAILGAALYAGIRLTPIYLEYLAVVRAMNQIAKGEDGSSISPAELRRLLDNRWAIEDIKSIAVKDIKIVKQGNGVEMNANYRAEAPFLGNVSLVVDFDKTVIVGPKS